RLARRPHRAATAFGRQRFKPAGVDDDVVARADLAVAVMAIARQAREISDERGARRRQAIEKRRLADVRTADDGNDRLHPAARPAYSTVTSATVPSWAWTIAPPPNARGVALISLPTGIRARKPPSSGDRKCR